VVDGEARNTEMALPEGNLTPAQFEIMEVVWNHRRNGATVAEVWQEISQTRDVARTTTLSLIDRLEKRGWLKRRERRGVNHFVATVTRQKAEGLLAGDFVDDFFGGSARDLVMSLLGTKRLNPADVAELREMLNADPAEPPEESS
jgi:BlaI family transcriptional regulator, penicillinase repressor